LAPLAGVAPFDYDTAFSRNFGWLTREEQDRLRTKRVAIAGLGGVGGFHLLALARLGVMRFNIADLDRFELANFNRQAGAKWSTLGQPKTSVLAAMARDINPDCELRVFDNGVHWSNLDRFFDDVDLYVDGLDAFALEARAAVFAQCAKRGIPAITAAPLGMSVAIMVFLPGRMTFEQYFGLEGRPDVEQSIRFLVGMAPALQHRHYLADPSAVDLRAGKGPSTVLACHLCAGTAAAEALKILLGRGKVRSAPHGFQFDAYRNKFVRTWRPGGNRHPLNRLAIAIAKRQLGL
jgi:molybdopterin/thiamine biosynthesis adenylyltransferase